MFILRGVPKDFEVTFAYCEEMIDFKSQSNFSFTTITHSGNGLGSEHQAGSAGRLLPFFCITQHMILAPQLAFKFVKEDRGKVPGGIQLCSNQACLSFG